MPNKTAENIQFFFKKLQYTDLNTQRDAIDNKTNHLANIYSKMQDDLNLFFFNDINSNEWLRSMYVVPNHENTPEINDCYVDYFKYLLQLKRLKNPVDTFTNMITSPLLLNEKIIMAGCPGTGKSSLINHLSRTLNIESTIISSSNFDNFNSTNKNEIMDRILNEIESETETKSQGNIHNRIRQLQKIKDKKIILHFIDNIDRTRNTPVEQLVFETAFNLHDSLIQKDTINSTKWIFVISLRRSTLFQLFVDQKSEFVRKAHKIFLLPPPPLAEVFEKRLAAMEIYAHKFIHNNPVIAKVRIEHEGREYHVEITRKDAFLLLKQFMNNLDEEAYAYLHNITLGGVRSQLRIFPEILKTKSFSESRISIAIIGLIKDVYCKTKTYDNQINEKITQKDIIYALDGFPFAILDNNLDFICDQNLFDNLQSNDHNDDFSNTIHTKNEKYKTRPRWQNFLVKIRILQYLTIKYSRLIDEDSGECLTSILYQFQKIGYDEKDITLALISLINSRLVLSTDLRGKNIRYNKLEHIVVSPLGTYYMEKVLDSFAYYETIVAHCPVNFQILGNFGTKRRYSSYHVAEMIRIIQLAETTEEFYATRNEGIHLLNMIRKEYLWKEMKNLWYTVSKGFYRDNESDNKGREILKKLPIMGYDFDTSYKVDEQCKKCLSLLLRTDPARFRNPYHCDSWRKENINLIKPEQEQTIGYELFFMLKIGDTKPLLDGYPDCENTFCSAGSIIEKIRFLGGERFNGTSVANNLLNLDKIFIKTLFKTAEKLCSENNHIRFLSINLAQETFESQKNIEITLNQLTNETSCRKIIFEIPEEHNPSQFVHSISKIISIFHEDQTLKIGKDDILSKKATATEHYYTKDIMRHVAFEKLDWETFQQMHDDLEMHKRLADVILGRCKAMQEHGGYFVVEGVQERHMEFILNLFNIPPANSEIPPYRPNNLCIQSNKLAFKN
ncbi:MAG: AAA family ATPase [Magnetococcales bacterium]|nr:AAA family ATPase [Magnetococcales bacterium]